MIDAIAVVLLLDPADGEVLHARISAPADATLPVAELGRCVAAEAERLYALQRRAAAAPNN